MAQFSRTWWGIRFIQALEAFTDSGRLGRGRSYASNGRILDYTIADGKVTARVRGSINPYFGVYEEPIYRTSISIKPISTTDWTKVIADLSSKAGFITKLLVNEMPDNIEEAFSTLDLHLLPHSKHDFTTSCSCPDYANPCKHIAGLYYLLAAALDRDPFLLFELRGLSRSRLHDELTTTPLGRILSSELLAQNQDIPVEQAASYYTKLEKEPAGTTINHKEFWVGAKRVPSTIERASQPNVPALLIKRQGDYPPFWPKDISFISTMEELYERVRTKNSQMK